MTEDSKKNREATDPTDPIERLRSLIERAMARGLFQRSDFGQRAAEQTLQATEEIFGCALPEDFRAFCSQIAQAAPCPDTPPKGAPFEIYLDQRSSSFEVVELLAVSSEITAQSEEATRPFPFKERWKQSVPQRCFKGKLLTQAAPEDFDRSIELPGLSLGASPFDGLHWLWGELQYCDSWYIEYALVLRGEARGQIWAYCADLSSLDKEPAGSLLLRPLASSFLDWYTRWLEAGLSGRW